jgi:hypothetical protein
MILLMMFRSLCLSAKSPRATAASLFEKMQDVCAQRAELLPGLEAQLQRAAAEHLGGMARNLDAVYESEEAGARAPEMLSALFGQGKPIDAPG